jgi:hypothetical protein
MLALLAGTLMFENRINNFVPNVGAPSFTPGVFPAVRGSTTASPSPIGVQIADIYQVAMQRAVEEHEIDKLFNPDFYDYQI